MLRRSIFLLAFILVVTQLSSCRKLLDVIFNGKDKQAKCRITSLDERINSEVKTTKFYYNNHNNIDSIISNTVSSGAQPNLFYLIYDQNHRLIEFRKDGEYPGEDGVPNYYVRHTYGYENGRITTDTIRSVAAVLSTILSELEYDLQGRVVREKVVLIETDGVPVHQELEPIVYEYGSDDNLVRDGISYDNKTNFWSTNKYLQFIERDYSRNNWVGATAYNSNGLPLGFDDRYDFGAYNILFSGLPEKIEYACEE